jgi:cytochrome P450
MQQATVFNPFDAEFKAHAFPAYARLRSAEPVYRLTSPDERAIWLVLGYEEGQSILKDYHRFANDPRAAMTAAQTTALLAEATAGLSGEERQQWLQINELLFRHVLSADPPDHSRLRKLVAQSFTPRFVEGLRPRVQQIADDLLDAIERQSRATGRRETDLIDAFAFPLPIAVISEMLGVPTADQDKFRAWSNAFVRFGPAVGRDPAFIESMVAFADYLRALCADKRRHPADALVTGLVLAETEGDALTENEVLSMVFLLIIAGHETTVNLIGNGVLALLEHPEQLAMLRRDPTLVKSAIEEMLRYYGPVELSVRRFAKEDLELGGQRIGRGDQVNVVLASADRDPEQFADPERFDITREPTRHLAFGTGIHACLGAPLARLEGQIAFPALLARLPEVCLAVPREQLTWRDAGILRGLTSLPVAF